VNFSLSDEGYLHFYNPNPNLSLDQDTAKELIIALACTYGYTLSAAPEPEQETTEAEFDRMANEGGPVRTMTEPIANKVGDNGNVSRRGRPRKK
jgi:hypothetical protein